MSYYDATPDGLEIYEDLEAPFPAHQYKIEFANLLRIFENLNASKVLEIGCHLGGSLFQFIKRMHPGSTIIAVDLPGGAWGQWLPQTIYDTWTNYANKYGVNLIRIPESSHDLTVKERLRKEAPFDFIFIDGDHTLYGATQDFELSVEIIRPGGVIALHDILRGKDPSIMVDTVWGAIKVTRYYKVEELFSKPGQIANGIGVVYMPERRKPDEQNI